MFFYPLRMFLLLQRPNPHMLQKDWQICRLRMVAIVCPKSLAIDFKIFKISKMWLSKHLFSFKDLNNVNNLYRAPLNQHISLTYHSFHDFISHCVRVLWQCVCSKLDSKSET